MNTEILATLGPASEDKLEQLRDAGMTGVRINSSHGGTESFAEMIETYRRIDPDGFVLFDIKGPKIRLGDFPGPLHVRAGNTLILRTDWREAKDGYPRTDDPDHGIPITYPDLEKSIKPGHRLFVDDGYIGLKVTAVENGRIECRVLYGETLRQRKGLNHPDTIVDYPYTMPYDVPLLEFAVQQKVDFIADSFTRDAEDVNELQGRLKDTGIKIVSKIENPQGVRNFDEVLQQTDAVMIARGDLGVEIDTWKVPELQKQFIDKCNAAGKPVITATQMLETMIDNPFPSRADVSDVANAIYDGSDVIMLSGETSIGRFPVECVEMMRRIATFIESTKRYQTDNKPHHSLRGIKPGALE